MRNGRREGATTPPATARLNFDDAEMAERAAKDAAQFHETDAREVHRLPRQLGHCYRCDGNHDSN